MKSGLLMITAILAMGFGENMKVRAQTPYTGRGTSGMFGYRVIGGGPSLGVSTPSMFGPRFIGPIQNSISLGIQSGGGANFSPPAPAPYSSSYLPPIRVTQIEPEGNANDRNNLNNIQEQPLLPEVGPQAYPEPNMPIGPEGMMPLEQGPGIPSGVETPGAATPAAMSTPYPRGWAFAASSLTGRSSSNARSTELSDRLTQIARDKGMLAGRRINVSLVGDTAVVEGTVRTPGDRAMLANVLSLEPRVQRIDNRLYAEEPKTAKSGSLGNR
jgi:hypothetical protein